MLNLWNNAKNAQLDLLEAAPAPVAPTEDATPPVTTTTTQRVVPYAPQMAPVAALCDDLNNPRTEFPEAEIDELAEDIRQHGVLQRHGLTPLDLARFIRARVDEGDSNATVARRMGIDKMTLAHHLALLDLPPELNEAMQAGRCISPRTLYELDKLHRGEPERVRALLAGDGEITRSTVNEFRAESVPTAHSPGTSASTAVAACTSRNRLCAARTHSVPGCEGRAARGAR